MLDKIRLKFTVWNVQGLANSIALLPLLEM